MGLLLGRPDMTDGGETMIITDAFPLAVEGAETRVVTDDATTLSYMANLSETLEQTRAEYLMGWYHSHPFDVDVNSHCYLSATDVQTQLGWQVGVSVACIIIFHLAHHHLWSSLL